MELPRMRLRSQDLARTLMEHDGDGTRVTVRDLAAATGRHPSYVGAILTGTLNSVPAEVAAAWARRLGVDLLVLWTPDERTAAAVRGEPEAVSA
jgi:hypothetical protein